MKLLVVPIATLAFAGLVFAQQPETVSYSYSGLPIPIVFSSDDAAIASITVPRALRISKVTVRVEVDYAGVGDLNVFFYSPLGTRTRLLERNCDRLVNIDTTFDDSATSRFSGFCPQEAGRGPFQGNEPLANSNNESSFGVWRLAVQNNSSQSGTGLLRSFTVTITGTPQTEPIFTPDTVVSSSSGRASYIAPGELVSIFGANLGPATPVSAPAGDLPGTLGNVTVFMDGIRCAISYASRGLLRIQVPYGEIPGTLALLQVANGNQNSQVIAIPVRTAAPGIYTTGATGRQAKAYNQNGQLNSASNKAAKGSFVTLYMTGLGITSPAVSSGIVAPSNPLLYAFYPIAIYVGGVSAPVQFAGLAPGLVGVYQINIQIGPNTPSGSNEILAVAINGAVSQHNVLLDIE